MLLENWSTKCMYTSSAALSGGHIASIPCQAINDCRERGAVGTAFAVLRARPMTLTTGDGDRSLHTLNTRSGLVVIVLRDRDKVIVADIRVVLSIELCYRSLSLPIRWYVSATLPIRTLRCLRAEDLSLRGVVVVVTCRSNNRISVITCDPIEDHLAHLKSIAWHTGS